MIDYQLISTLPSITSESTYLTCYTFVDTLSKGLTYNKNDVALEFFTDAACTQSVARWTGGPGGQVQRVLQHYYGKRIRYDH